MNKILVVFLLAITTITTGSVVCMQPYSMPYGHPYGGVPGAPPYGQPHQGPCSKHELEMRRQKNAAECQQQMAMCQQGYAQICPKAQEDCNDVQQYAMLRDQCPYP